MATAAPGERSLRAVAHEVYREPIAHPVEAIQNNVRAAAVFRRASAPPAMSTLASHALGFFRLRSGSPTSSRRSTS